MAESAFQFGFWKRAALRLFCTPAFLRSQTTGQRPLRGPQIWLMGSMLFISRVSRVYIMSFSSQTAPTYGPTMARSCFSLTDGTDPLQSVEGISSCRTRVLRRVTHTVFETASKLGVCGRGPRGEYSLNMLTSWNRTNRKYWSCVGMSSHPCSRPQQMIPRSVRQSGQRMLMLLANAIAIGVQTDYMAVNQVPSVPQVGARV